MICQNCSSKNDVMDFYIGEDKHVLCVDCRVKLVTNQESGRPSLSITKKVSLTLPEEEWNWLDKEANGKHSQYLRQLVWEAQSSEYEWSNNACLGYAILGLEKLKYPPKEIEKIVRALYVEFDMKTLDEAKEKYNTSSY